MPVTKLHHPLLSQMHDWLKEIMIPPQMLVELIEQMDVCHGIQTAMAHISAHQTMIVFFYKTIIFFFERTTA